MVKQPQESVYVKSSNLVNDMRMVYEMRHLQHLSIPEIVSKTGINRSRVYKFLAIFASEYPDLVEQMKKKKEDVTPDEYKKLLEELSTLKSELKRLGISSPRLISSSSQISFNSLKEIFRLR